MATWSQDPVRHPWFDMPVTKRKIHPEDERDNHDIDILDAHSSSSHKRRRCNTLEHGLAHLTLGNVSPHSPDRLNSHLPSIPSASSPILEVPISDHSMMSMNGSQSSLVVPDLVEEPGSPQQMLPEVKMRGPSWYEPEKDRIVVTDLDDSDEEIPDKERPREDNPDISVSSTFLELIKSRSVRPDIPLGDDRSTMALVLFRPLQNAEPASGSNSNQEEDEQKNPTEVSTVVQEDDAMDIES